MILNSTYAPYPTCAVAGLGRRIAAFPALLPFIKVPSIPILVTCFQVVWGLPLPHLPPTCNPRMPLTRSSPPRLITWSNHCTVANHILEYAHFRSLHLMSLRLTSWRSNIPTHTARTYWNLSRWVVMYVPDSSIWGMLSINIPHSP